MKKLILLLTALIIALNVSAQNMHGDMETWRNISVTTDTTTLQSPQYWYNTDSVIFMAKYVFPSATFVRQAFPTTDAHSGSTAAKLVTRHQDTLGILPGLLTNAMPFIPAGTLLPAYTGGLSVTTRISAISSWMKYYPNGNDTAILNVRAIIAGAAMGGTDSVVGYGEALLTGVHSGYAQYITYIHYNDTSVIPNKIQVFFASSNAAPKDSSVLFVDDISVFTTGIDDVKEKAFTCYPNPATTSFNIEALDNTPFSCIIYNIYGQLVKTVHATGGAKIDVENYANGLYYYLLTSEDNATHAGKFIVSH